MGTLDPTQFKKIQQGKSLKGRFEAMHAVHFSRENIKQVLEVSEGTGVKDLDLTSQAILLRSQAGDFEEAFELASWSAKAKPASRKAVVKSFLKTKQAPLLVHQMARMKRNEAADMMKDYFTEGGDIKDVAEWLTTAGQILKTGMVPDDTDGLWSWVKKTAGKVVDAVKDAINTVADAIKTAGKNLAEAISTVASWAQDKVSDFVEAVMAAGKSVAEVLAEAVKKGTAALNKFIQAVIEAGKKGIDVLNWAVNQVESTLRTALSKLESMLGSFTSLLFEIAKMAVSKLANVVKALLAAGKKVLDFVSRLDRIALDIAKRIVQEIKKLGRTVREIMTAVINRGRNIARIVIDALRAIGTQVFDMLKEIVNRTIAELTPIFGALKDLAISLGAVLNEVGKFVAAQAKKLMTALREIWKVVKEVLEAIATKTASVIKTLLTALLGTAIHLGEVVGTIIQNVRAAFREGLIKGLIELGKSAVTLMVEAVKISASAAAVLFGIILEVFGSHRGLTAAERAEAEKVFGTSIDLDRVKITDASLAADFVMWMNKNRPFVTMYVINYKSKGKLPMDELIHEMTHIWQAVNSGGVYMIEALHSQFFGKGYNLSEEDVKKAKGNLLKLEREQQAVLVQEFYKAEFQGKSIGLPLDLIRPLAKQVYKASFNFRPIRVTEFDLGRRFILAGN
ncbi:hypothetical protein [Algoriphagus litoralis]|uniref:hypothetical protein n=1 Tax=Algoriphagus litoralis TaxID=2202829 RepID=UPI000DB9EA31|nr:hypothetical protein [Algoriphagus litoralis]